MPPVHESIAGGANLYGVRDRVRWIPSPSSSITSLASLDADTRSDSSRSSESCPSLSDGSDLSSSPTSSNLQPPSPPLRVIADPFAATTTRKADDFMARVFPSSTKVADRIVPVPAASPVWSLALFDDSVQADGLRTLYAQANCSDKMNLRENVVQLLDAADEDFGCDQVVVVLEKDDPSFSATLHSLLYVGGVVIPPNAASPLKKAAPAYVLVGIDI